MPRLLSLSPILLCADLGRTSAHYQQLGFRFAVHAEGYGTASRDGFNLHFSTQPDLTAMRAGAVYFAVDHAEALHAEWVAAGVGETSDLYDPGFKVWEAAHTDPDGNVIRFGSPIA